MHHKWLPRSRADAASVAAVRRHLESGAGLLLVSGEAGIGKTRLVTTAADLARQRTFVATGAGLPLSSEVALLPVGEIMRAIRDVDDGLWLKEALGDCPAFVRGSLRRLLPEVDAPETLSEPDDGWSRQRLFTAVGSTLAALSTIRPFAVVLEDLHWADAMTLDLVEVLAGRVDAVPLRRDLPAGGFGRSPTRDGLVPAPAQGAHRPDGGARTAVP